MKVIFMLAGQLARKMRVTFDDCWLADSKTKTPTAGCVDCLLDASPTGHSAPLNHHCHHPLFGCASQFASSS